MKEEESQRNERKIYRDIEPRRAAGDDFNLIQAIYIYIFGQPIYIYIY